MKKKPSILPIDERIIPDIFSFKYPKSFWVRAMLFMEMIFAVVALIGTLILVLLPRSPVLPTDVSASLSSPSSK